MCVHISRRSHTRQVYNDYPHFTESEARKNTNRLVTEPRQVDLQIHINSTFQIQISYFINEETGQVLFLPYYMGFLLTATNLTVVSQLHKLNKSQTKLINFSAFLSFLNSTITPVTQAPNLSQFLNFSLPPQPDTMFFIISVLSVPFSFRPPMPLFSPD